MRRAKTESDRFGILGSIESVMKLVDFGARFMGRAKGANLYTIQVGPKWDW